MSAPSTPFHCFIPNLSQNEVFNTSQSILIQEGTTQGGLQ